MISANDWLKRILRAEDGQRDRCVRHALPEGGVGQQRAVFERLDAAQPSEAAAWRCFGERADDLNQPRLHCRGGEHQIPHVLAPKERGGALPATGLEP
eukprot:988111-Prymnesium_polylepis.1